MLRHTFQHIEGYGKIKETELWKSGIFNWSEYVKRKSHQLEIFESYSSSKLLEESILAFEKRDANFFAKTLRATEFYRIALSFPEDVMFMDIETTGLSRYYDHITLIGWSFLNEFNVYYPGLDTTDLYAAFKKAKCIVTFNGSLFDLPFIKSEFPNLEIPICHIDLRFFAKRFGYSGGQKIIEKAIGFERSLGAEKITGEIAPVLWHKYKEGDINALKKLITYNLFDVDGMKRLLDICIDQALTKLQPFINLSNPFKFSEHYSNAKFSKKRLKGYLFIKPFEGKTGPTINLTDLPVYENLSIVGIDLTGSEERATGWCHLLYDKAITKRINSNQDIIEETLRCKPDIVSIDSPLSLPKGRKTVFDDDEGRNEFGIMRECERILKRRGVNVYPSLIPSMQRLTQRGIMLADEFRKRGVPVIESYPGAAQDILGIPRKRASLEYLVKGLSGFGIKGDYETIEVSHDELDAITSAMLGYFFWCGKFEALGNDDENYLIIPDIKKTFPEWQNKKVFGLSGGLASGKTTAGEYFSEKGFKYGRFSMVIAKLVEEQGNDPNKRDNLLEMGDYVNKEKGQRWLCKTLIQHFFNNEERIVIDGLRFPDDHAYMKEKFGPNFTHIHLNCNNTIRKERYDKLERNNVEFEDAITHNVEREVNKLGNIADVLITNDRDLNYLYQQLNSLLIN